MLFLKEAVTNTNDTDEKKGFPDQDKNCVNDEKFSCSKKIYS